MALKRATLKAMGLTDEQVNSIIEMHTETVDGLKADLAKYRADAEKLPGVQKELDDLKAAGDGGYKEKYEKEKKAFDDFKAEQTAKESRAAKEAAYRKLLKDAGISEKYIEDVMGVAKLDELEMDGDKFKDADNISKTVKEKFSAFVTTTRTDGVKTDKPPANGGGTMTREEIYKKDDKGRYLLDAAARQKALAESMNNSD